MKKFNLILFMAVLSTKFLLANWAEETLKKLTLDEKIGQLFLSAVIVNPDFSDPVIAEHAKKIDHAPIEKLIKAYHIGGVVLDRKTATPTEQLNYVNRLQEMSKVPLIIAQDLEWGLDMRLKDVVKFPFNIALGAIEDNNLIYELGKEIGRQSGLVGVNFNFAPVVDVNTNPKNPIINHRSFGQDKERVLQKAKEYIKGLSDSGILCCAKHFPGHGDTSTDSHLDLPTITHDLERLESVELYPFKKLIDFEIAGIMVGHLHVPALDNTENLPATLSYKITTELLKNRLGFKNLIITDALNMEGVVKNKKPGEVEISALLAGADILLAPKDTPLAIYKIKEAIGNGIISENLIDQKVLKILKAKEWIIKNKQKNSENSSLDKDNFMQELNSEYAKNLAQKLYAQAITLVKNENNILPITQMAKEDSKKDREEEKEEEEIACIQICEKESPLTFFKNLNKEIKTKNFYLSNNAAKEDVLKLINDLDVYKKIIIGLLSMNNNPKEKFGICDSTLQLLNELFKNNKHLISCVFGNPYSLKFFENSDALLCAYENTKNAQISASKIVCGKSKPRGKLPVSASEKFSALTGLTL